MPRFYFNIRSSQTLRQDTKGEEHDTLHAAEEEATASAREIIAGDYDGGSNNSPQGHVDWMEKILSQVTRIAETLPRKTFFNRFIPPAHPEQAHGAWQLYYRRWSEMMLKNYRNAWWTSFRISERRHQWWAF